MDHLLTFGPFILLFTFSFFSGAVKSAELTIVNRCRSMIWPVLLTNYGPSLTPTGFVLDRNESRTLSVSNSWNGRIWGRTNCSTNSTTGNFSCLSGDCGSGRVECNGSRGPPATLVELSVNSLHGLDFYDVSLVNGFNLPILVAPVRENCSSTSCLSDLNAACPQELGVERGNQTVSCMSACIAFNTQLHCCRGGATRCQSTAYSNFFKDSCPQASYALDDATSTFTCASSTNYSIIFCARANTSTALAPAPAPAPAPPLTVVPVPREAQPSRNWNKRLLIIPGAVVILLGLLSFLWCRRRKHFLQVMRRTSREKGNEDSLSFNYTTIEIATNYFSDEAILGRGGYGPVYKGKLLNGQEIAVKRLQKMSGHGTEQYKIEISVISNLQHRNLVKLLGYCSDHDERILIYEYLPNKSLDSILFDAEKRVILDWKLRLRIIEGIAQGLLYLHKYSRLKIIHRDLKTSNILLDKDLNPKISDFGTAKIFGDDESFANTNRIVGTYGYMAPEYAMDGIFSMKSDVFSFGVMVLEIISGKKNTGFYNSDRHINLLGYVWDLWNEERFMEIADPNLVETIPISEILRHVQIGLLCVQENASDRPTMSIVVHMLQNESMPLPTPKQPSFTAILSVTNSKIGETLRPASVNMVTISDVNGR